MNTLKQFINKLLGRLSSEDSKLIRKLLSGTFWVSISSMVMKGSSFVSTFVFARLFGPAWLGLYSVIITNVNVIDLFTTSGVSKVANRETAMHKDLSGLRELHGFCLYGSIVIAAFVFLFAGWFSRAFLENDSLANPLRIASGLIVLYSVMNVYRGALFGGNHFRDIAISNAIGGFSSILLTIGGALIWGLSGAIAGLLVSTLITTFALIVQSGKRFGRESVIPARMRWRNWIVIGGILMPFFVSAITFYPVNYVAVMLMYKGTGGAADVGFYQASMTCKSTLLMFSGMITAPFMTSYLSNVKSDIRRWERMNVGMTLGIVLLATLPITLFPEPFAMIFGSKFHTGNLSLVISAFAASSGITIIKNITFNRMMANGSMNMWGTTNVLWAVMVVAMIALSPVINAQNVALAILVGDAIHAVILLVWINRRGELAAFHSRWDCAVLGCIALLLFCFLACALPIVVRCEIAFALLMALIVPIFFLISKLRKRQPTAPSVK
jgi:O-antigen/teichoic acid export membrane protein